MTLRPLIIVGTRPEAIKLAPVIWACRELPDQIKPIVCFTGQHRELLDPIAEYFDIEPDIRLDVLRPGQSLAALSARCLEQIDGVLADQRPDCVVVQGDTTSVLAAAMAAFYRKVPLVHVEAGLRTGNLEAPWPEELNRTIVGLTAAVHCCPTPLAAHHLSAAGVPPDRIHVTGNTVVDSLLWTLRREQPREYAWRSRFAALGARRMVLITGHRRENIGPGLRRICRAIRMLADRFPEIEFVYPVHLNPGVYDTVHRLLSGAANIHLLPPASYPEFVWLMKRSALILTDSGGVQEEAPTLHKPVLVMRESTERLEGVEAGTAQLVGTSIETIVRSVTRLLADPAEYARRRPEANPYGDGWAARRIVELMTSMSPNEDSGHRRQSIAISHANGGNGGSVADGGERCYYRSE